MDMFNTPTNRKEFKITLYCNNRVICESVFDAECYNQLTRNNLNVRDDFYYYIGEIKSLLNSDELKDDFYGYNLDGRCNNENEQFGLFKLMLNNDDNVVIEREFRSNFINKSLYSSDIVEFMRYIVRDLSSKIRSQDINMMWEDYDIIRYYNIDIMDVRNLSPYIRKSRLDNIYKQY